MTKPRLLIDLERTAQWLIAYGLAGPEHVVDSLPTPRIVVDGRSVISFSSNNYLGLSRHMEVKAAAIKALIEHSYATSESRRLGGNLRLLEQLETALAVHKQMPAAMVTATGLLANIAAIHGVIDAVPWRAVGTVHRARVPMRSSCMTSLPTAASGWVRISPKQPSTSSATTIPTTSPTSWPHTDERPL